MPPIPQLPQTEKPASRHPMLVPAVTLLLVAAANILAFRYLSPSSGGGILVHQTSRGWERPPAPADPHRVRVSPRGVVWVSTWPGGLSRLESGRWRHFSKADFGTERAYLRDMALDGEDVWAIAGEGVLRWNGRGWHCYREALASKNAYSIAAGAGRAWVVDRSGNLSEFDGTRWTIRKLDLPAVRWEEKGEMPKLARTADGTLWLKHSGLWRFDGARWIPTAPLGRSLNGTWIVGATAESVWLWDGDTLRSVTADGKTWAEYPVEAFADDVASAAGHTWIASIDGILELDGASWRRMASPGGGIKEISSISVAPDGGLWAIGETESKFGRWSLIARAVVILLLPVCFIAALVWMAKRSSWRKRQEHERIRQAVQHATGEVPYELEQLQRKAAAASNPWRAGLILGGSIVGGMVAYSVVHRWWPKEPAWMVVVFAVAIHFAITFWQSLTKRKPLPSDPIGPGGPSRYDWATTGKAVGAGLFLLLLYNIPHLSGYWYLALIVLPVAYQFLDVRLMLGALHRTDYDAALRTVRLFHFFNPQGALALRRYGIILLLAGRYREAEDALRRSLAGLKTGTDQAVALDYLGETLMELGRNDEAQRSFDASLHAVPGFRRPYRGMAEMALRQGRNPQQALEYVEEIRGGSVVSRTGRANRKTEDDYWALKAWALGELGRSGEVAPAIEAAFKATNQKSRTELAATAYRAGMAMQAIGNQAAANNYFKRARDLDPNGRRGTLAQAALHTHSVWGD